MAKRNGESYTVEIGQLERKLSRIDLFNKLEAAKKKETNAKTAKAQLEAKIERLKAEKALAALEAREGAAKRARKSRSRSRGILGILGF